MPASRQLVLDLLHDNIFLIFGYVNRLLCIVVTRHVSIIALFSLGKMYIIFY